MTMSTELQRYQPERDDFIHLDNKGDYVLHADTVAFDKDDLAAERDQLRLDLKDMQQSRDEYKALYQTAYNERAALQSANKALAADRSRLEWLAHKHNLHRISSSSSTFFSQCKEPYCWDKHPTLRAAIDAAMEVTP